jgi:AcrR family transcriptional regulator
MPYSREHKERTRARIIDAASRLFRRRGYQDTGVDALMGEAGLTRGGFYAHFRDKADLFIRALDHAFDESFENLLGRGLEDLVGAEWLRAASRRYLNPQHRTHPHLGCAVPTLGGEVSRAPRRVKNAFGRRIENLIDRMAERLDGDRELAMNALASWVGALVLARAAHRVSTAEVILTAVQRHWDRVADELEAEAGTD